ncbi:hypothetical protein, partial [Actinomyces dentalis]|uniref:hypothetical protein n=1 Tax=Actinomyces dentalis TaxID=272548 RepID=UPI0023558239
MDGDVDASVGRQVDDLVPRSGQGAGGLGPAPSAPSQSLGRDDENDRPHEQQQAGADRADDPPGQGPALVVLLTGRLVRRRGGQLDGGVGRFGG